ncbi:MAG: 4-hydroxyphenylacetate 3-hydroxylase [Candidatus Eisenbacteria bacterium]|nr:4-hydroxyphenylacetate 3-hydroxylase [Candidatus Eisenbacteria bacterium]
MSLKTREDYIASLRRLRPNVYKFGEEIADVTTHPATRRTVESHARGFDAAHDATTAPFFTTKSSLTGEPIHRHNSLIESMEDLVANMRVKREMYHRTGSCTGGLCVGWNAMNVLWAATHEIDAEKGTDYHERIKKWILSAQQNGWVAAGALTDPKGDRSLPPSQQPDPDSYLRRVASTPEGIVVRGAKVMICGVAASNEIIVLPGSFCGEADQDYAISFAIPRDAEGLTIVEARRPSDTREQEDGIDAPTETGITQSYLIFQDVRVPIERVFLNGEFNYAGRIIEFFTGNYRACIGACVAGQGDVMVGAATLMARANGLSAKAFMDKLVQMQVNNETTFAVGVGSIALGKRHPSGVWFADPLTANVNKVHVATLPQETRRLCQEIGGGIVETGCLPSSKDLDDPNYGELIRKYLQTPACSGETRARAARLSEWLTVGPGVPGCMHGGGSPQAAKMTVRVKTPLEEWVRHARKIAGIEEDLPEPGKGKK